MDNPDISKEELVNFFNKNNFDPKYLVIGIELYMKESDAIPDKEIYNDIFTSVNEMRDIPKGSYSIILNDNFINRRRGIGAKENTIDKTKAEKIIKD